MFANDVREGLSQAGQKQRPCQYFYDDIGTALFEAITVLPEYGLTRADTRLIRRLAPELTGYLQAPVAVAELGSGSGSKQRRVLGWRGGAGGRKGALVWEGGRPPPPGNLLSHRSLGLRAGPLRARDGRGRRCPSHRRIVFEWPAPGGLRQTPRPATAGAVPGQHDRKFRAHRRAGFPDRSPRLPHARRRLAARRGPDQAAGPHAPGL